MHGTSFLFNAQLKYARWYFALIILNPRLQFGSKSSFPFLILLAPNLHFSIYPHLYLFRWQLCTLSWRLSRSRRGFRRISGPKWENWNMTVTRTSRMEPGNTRSVCAVIGAIKEAIERKEIIFCQKPNRIILHTQWQYENLDY